MLIEQQERLFGPGGRWHVPNYRYEFLEALKAGEAVVLSSSSLLCVLSPAGLPHADYCFGRRYWGSTFVLDERDQLTEVAG
ncbi:MAG: hypothetical protein WBZ37_02445 [Mycobacterium sp.]